MCAPTSTANRERKTVIISGAGPAGLLLCSLLLNKNKDENCNVTYDVTLLDGRPDYASFTKEELVKNHRSWMLGLADHGMDAIKTLPALYENYVKGEGILVQEFSLHIGKKRFTQTIESSDAMKKFITSTGSKIPEAFIVDRNFIVAALARYLKDTHGKDPHYTSRYETKSQYVDYENKRVLVRDVKTKEDEYLSYDLLVGCDGVRSTVREAIVKCHSDFQFEYTDIFQEFKQMHVEQPLNVSKKGLSLLPDVFPKFTGILLPETRGLANIAMGTTRNYKDDVPEELMSDDYKVVADYVRKNMHAIELVDYDDFAKQWVGQRWNQTGMVHCNFYHSLKAGVVIMGDAAHATSPALGMGMNTALRDAEIFSALLEETDNDFEKALPAFSEARVKEGNALSDLSFYLSCLDTKHQFLETIHMIIRSFFFSKFPNWVAEHPQSMIGRRGVSLADCYEQAVKLGVMNKHRAINDRIRMDYFEQKSGMVRTPPNQGRSMYSKVVILGIVLAAVAAYVYPSAVQEFTAILGSKTHA